MGFKKIDRNLSFADLALANSMEKNRSLSTMKQLDKVIDWSRIEACLMAHYDVGFSNEGADAYPPLMLFKCLFLQKWFRIPSEPELESQINDRISLAKEVITINEGIAVDARLVKSASRPISNDEIKKLRKKKETAEGKVDKNGKPLKFSRDLESG